MNKIIVSIVLAVILVLGINKITDAIFYVEKPEKSAYSIQIVETTTIASTTNSEGSGPDDIMALFASVNSAQGKKLFSKCQSCHNIAKGYGNHKMYGFNGFISNCGNTVTIKVFKG